MWSGDCGEISITSIPSNHVSNAISRYESTWMSTSRLPSLTTSLLWFGLWSIAHAYLRIPVQELCRLGILYDINNADSRSAMSAPFSWTMPAQKSFPAYTVRHSKSRRLRRRPTWQGLPLKLSLSNLRDDHDLARLLSPISTSQPPVRSNPEQLQSRPVLISTDKLPALPQSLPKSSPSSTALVSSPLFTNNDLSISLSQTFIPTHSFTHEDWTLITPTLIAQEHTHPSIASTPQSESETWILLGDDL